MGLTAIFSLILATCLLVGCGQSQQSETMACAGVPHVAREGRVTDAAKIFERDKRVALETRLAAYEKQTQHQLVIATIPALNHVDVANYGHCLGDRWGIGRKGVNDGIVLLVAPNDRRVNISTGTGMEKMLTDDEAMQVIHHITPFFKTGDYAGGLMAAVSDISLETGGKR